MRSRVSGKDPLAYWAAWLNWEESLEPVCLRGHAVPQALLHASDKRESWLGVGVAIDALGGGVRAYAIGLLWHIWFCEALKAEMSSGCVRGVATDATALSVRGAFRAASSWVAKSPAEGALSSGGGRPHRPDRADAVEK